MAYDHSVPGPRSALVAAPLSCLMQSTERSVAAAAAGALPAAHTRFRLGRACFGSYFLFHRHRASARPGRGGTYGDCKLYAFGSKN